MTPDRSTLPALAPLWEIQANCANTRTAIVAAYSVIPEFP